VRCPHCAHEDSKVTDSRAAESGIRRRRECLRCNKRFTTYERVQSAAVQVIKRDERREEFNREKLASSIRKASGKRPLPVNAIDKLAGEVEGEVQYLGRAEISSSLIGEMVMERLKGLDRVAYIRFASVYRDFADIDNFRDEIESLMEARESRATSAQLPLLPGEKPMPRAARRRPRRPRGARLPSVEEGPPKEAPDPEAPGGPGAAEDG
jgi:transcriptional repressor NrdR